MRLSLDALDASNGAHRRVQPLKTYDIATGEEDVTEIKREGIIRENLIVEGNNLIALHTLKQQFRSKVKLIYIDPPYNTKGDANIFGYNNNFNHSTWLTFIKNRLDVAKEMLAEDGVIVIAIDDHEYAHCKVLCDEIFGRDNSFWYYRSTK